MSCNDLNTPCGTGEIYVKFFYLHLITRSYPQNLRKLTASLQCSHPDCLLSSGGKCANSGRFPISGQLGESNIGVGDDAARPGATKLTVTATSSASRMLTVTSPIANGVDVAPFLMPSKLCNGS